MKYLAIKYYNEGYNCGQCILKAAEEKYKFCLCQQLLDGYNAINNGFGYGGLCSAIAAVIMVFGIMFSPECSKRLRMLFLDSFNARMPGFNCCKLSCVNPLGCEQVIECAAEIADKLISEELMRADRTK